jgi:hypothetical protein
MKLDAIREKLKTMSSSDPYSVARNGASHSGAQGGTHNSAYDGDDGLLPWDAAPSSVAQSASALPDAPTLQQLHNTLDMLQQRSIALGSRPFTEPELPTAPPPPPQTPPTNLAAAADATASAYDRLIELSWQRLASQAQRVNQLAAAQAAALVEFKTIAERLERDVRRREMALNPAVVPAPLTVWEYGPQVEVPHLAQNDQGRYQLEPQPVDLFQAERDAAQTAQNLRGSGRFHARRSQADLGPDMIFQEPWGWLHGSLTWLGKGLSRVLGSHRPLGLTDGFIWLSCAALGRLALGALASFYPGLWPVMIALLVGVGAIALFQALFAAEADLGLGYRLLIVLAGLLIAGRFF